MESVRFSHQAEKDLTEIGRHTFLSWGPAQADRYLSQLESQCSKLAKNPNMGRSCDHIRSGLRRFELAKHVVFYRKISGGILIVRILHQKMLPELRELDDDL